MIDRLKGLELEDYGLQLNKSPTLNCSTDGRSKMMRWTWHACRYPLLKALLQDNQVVLLVSLVPRFCFAFPGVIAFE